MPRAVLLDENNHLAGVVPAGVPRAARQVREASAPLRDMADANVIVVQASIQVFDLIARMREENRRIAIMTPDGALAGKDSVLGVVTWDDLVQNANPSHLLDRGGVPNA